VLIISRVRLLQQQKQMTLILFWHFKINKIYIYEFQL